MIKHFNNLISNFYLEDIQDTVFSADYTWVRHNETAGGYNGNYAWIEDENTEECDLFTHKPSRNPNDRSINFEPLIYTISDLMGYKIEVDRIKTNLMLPQLKNKINGYNRPHIDFPDKGMKTLLLYLNDADGDTFMFDKIYTGEDPGKLSVIERVTPKANSAILFDSDRYHASSIPTLGKRSVINVVFWDGNAKKNYQDEQEKNINLPFEPLPNAFLGTGHIKSFFNKEQK